MIANTTCCTHANFIWFQLWLSFTQQSIMQIYFLNLKIYPSKDRTRCQISPAQTILMSDVSILLYLKVQFAVGSWVLLLKRAVTCSVSEIRDAFTPVAWVPDSPFSQQHYPVRANKWHGRIVAVTENLLHNHDQFRIPCIHQNYIEMPAIYTVSCTVY